ncbi:MAG: NAD(P)-dependent dehydrogenase (short-subunit alcohol dehydrogenase family) [Planctomycetota bacterium]|jgi:NAD(P)-dependent dehydrogenase (short-subunit alcohol dehydrogenase family)
MSSTATTKQDPAAGPIVPPIKGVHPDRRRAIVVGASSGMGAALVTQLASEGYTVAALARRDDMLAQLVHSAGASATAAGGRVITRTHDVEDTAAVPAMFEELVREMGGLDLFIYAAGVMPEVEWDEYDSEKDLLQMRVNLGGCMAWCNEAAKLFHTQREGRLIGISSIAGDRGRKGAPAYGATKAAMNAYLESLRNRLSEVGARVLTVKPGFIATPMTEGLDGLFWLITAEEAASTILASARGGFWETRYVPLRWGIVGSIIRLIPSFVFKRLSF